MIEVVRLDAPDGAYLELLDQTVFGNRGLTFRRTNWSDVVGRWRRLGGVFLAARDGGRTVGTYALVPHTIALAGQTVRTWYRAGLSVAPAARKTGVAAAMAAEVRRRFVDESPEPVVCYGIVERDNEPSQRVQLGASYAPIAACRAVPVGELRPLADPAVGPLRPGDEEAVLALLDDRWAGHVLGTDFRGSLYPDETFVLREGGRVLACGAGRLTSLDLSGVPGVRGRLLAGLSPALRRVSPLFALRPNRHLLLTNLGWTDVDALRRLLGGMLAASGVAHGIVLVDDRSPHAEVLSTALRGRMHRFVPSPALDVWAGWKGLSDEAVRQLCDRPVVFAPGDSA